MSQIFISYSRVDTEFTQRLVDRLRRAYGHDAVWYDNNLHGGARWWQTILAQIAACEVFIYLLSNDSVTSPNCQAEYAEARRLQKPIVTVQVRDRTQLSADLGEIHYINMGSGINDENISDLNGSINKIVHPPKALTPLPIMPSDENAPVPVAFLPKVDPIAARAYKSRHNRDWKPMLTTFSNLPIPDMKFCLVPVGGFQIGATDINDAEKPNHPQKIDQPFWVAQTPVTNAQWKVAVGAGIVDVPVTGEPRTWYQDAKMANAPVVGIDWFAATTFAEWFGARLLTELEWEYAARGVESWVYPWGDTWVPDNAVFVDNSEGRPNDVSTRPQGASWVGALHLSGNVWEWTSSIFASYPYALDTKHEDFDNRTGERVRRGGSWDANKEYARAAFRLGYYPDKPYDGLGFRVGRFA